MPNNPTFFTCLNIKMSNTSGKSSPDQNIDTYINAQVNWRADRGDVQFLMKITFGLSLLKKVQKLMVRQFM